VVGDACSTAFPSASFEVIVSSLGDPYNCVQFWRETFRLLTVGGVCLFTTPAVEWAAQFRSEGKKMTAEFLRSDGAIILTRSEILPIKDQIDAISETGFQVQEIRTLTVAELTRPLSPKLSVAGKHDVETIALRGLIVSKN